MGAVAQESPGLLTSPEAFAAFYTEMLPRIYGYMYHRLAGPAAAEDLTQETFLAAVAEIKKGKVVADPTKWIMGIARHKWLDQLRKGMRDQRRIALVWQSEQLDDQEARIAWEGESSREQALAALGSVPDNQRGVLCLRYLDGYSVPEIARMIGRSVHATESMLARGRENFKLNYARSRP